ncbi:PAS domain S-box-containing protein [Catalinimonas alkaloidigena]|uniref:PAS domain-containing sensor histidine kinase n=1 Tax=Catalinimonas alkaloidigena TaxID=1075417 RepID=UPI0024071C07|nr:PAS domain-containing protein [Catalinimonas alkaloidigena]MDF9798462.1 PAS domain S-box-containing protein [Catalinimonas alkaloidigena]
MENIEQVILENTLVGYWDWNIAENTKYLSPQFKSMLGYEDHELPNSPETWETLIFPEDLVRVSKIYHGHTKSKGKIPYKSEVRYKHKNGSTVWVVCTGRVIEWDEDDKPVRMVGCYIDITLQKAAEKKLKTQNNRFQSILAGTNSGTWEWNVQTGDTIFNERWAEIIGYTLEELQPVSIETWLKHTHPDDLKRSGELLEDHFVGKTDFYECECRMLHKNGHWVWVLDRGKVISWTLDGKPLWMAGSHQEITERKNNEAQLEKYKYLLGKANQVAKIGTWEIDFKKNRPIWNEGTRKIHEVDAHYQPDMETAILFYPEGEQRDKITDAVKKAINEGLPFDLELQILTAKNNLIWVRAIGIPDFENMKCRRLYGIFQDIDEQKKSTLKLTRSEEQFRQTFTHAAIGMALVSTEGKWLQVNKQVCDMLGYTEEELLQKTFQDITHPDDLDIDLSYVQQMLDNEISSYQMEKRYFHKNGGIVWGLLAVSLVKDGEGNPLHFVSQIQDISELKKAYKQLEESVSLVKEQNDRLINFAHIVSHNLRSHTGNLEMMLKFLSMETDEEEKKILLENITGISSSLSETITYLTEVVRIQTDVDGQKESLNLKHFLDKTINTLSADLRKTDGEIVVSVDEETEIIFNSAYLDSVLLNFLSNALKYRHPKRKPHIKIWTEKQDDYLILSIADNGRGIDLDKYGAKLFGLYKTFHEHQDARGVGLFITKNQIEAMGGKVSVESTINIGTTFRIYFCYEKNKACVHH